MKCQVCGVRFVGLGVEHRGLCSRCRRGKHRTLATIAAEIRANADAAMRGAVDWPTFRERAAGLWREVDLGQPLYCGVRSRASVRVGRVLRLLDVTRKG